MKREQDEHEKNLYKVLGEQILREIVLSDRLYEESFEKELEEYLDKEDEYENENE